MSEGHGNIGGKVSFALAMVLWSLALPGISGSARNTLNLIGEEYEGKGSGKGPVERLLTMAADSFRPADYRHHGNRGGEC